MPLKQTGYKFKQLWYP